MGIFSSLGLSGGAKKSTINRASLNKWQKQGMIGLKKTLDKSNMIYRDKKKIIDHFEPALKRGKRLSHDKIIRESKKKFGYDFGGRVQKALTPKIKQELQKPSLDEQAKIEKKAEKKKKVNIFLGLKSSREAEEYKKTKGAMEAGSGFGWQEGQQQPTEQDKGLGLEEKPAFQGVGSPASKPASPLPDTTPKTPSSPIIPLANR